MEEQLLEDIVTENFPDLWIELPADSRGPKNILKKRHQTKQNNAKKT